MNWEIFKQISKDRNSLYSYLLVWGVILGIFNYLSKSLSGNILITTIFIIGFIIGDFTKVYKQKNSGKFNLQIKKEQTNGKSK